MIPQIDPRRRCQSPAGVNRYHKAVVVVLYNHTAPRRSPAVLREITGLRCIILYRIVVRTRTERDQACLKFEML